MLKFKFGVETVSPTGKPPTEAIPHNRFDSYRQTVLGQEHHLDWTCSMGDLLQSARAPYQE